MIRVVIFGVSEAHGREIDARVRGATVQAGAICDVEESAKSCDAAVFLGPLCGNSSEIEPFILAGKPVLLSAETRSADDWLRHVPGRSKTAVVIGNRERYLPSRRIIQQQIASGMIGQPGLMRLHRWESENANHLGRAGSLLCDLDLIMWYFGQAPILVYAVEQHAGRQIHLGFSAGGMSLVDHVHQSNLGSGYTSVSVIGSDGAIYADDHQNMQLLFSDGQPLAVRADEGFHSVSNLVQDFMDYLTKSIGNPFDHWESVLAVSDAVQESLRTKRAVAPKGRE